MENAVMRILFSIILVSGAMCGPLGAQFSDADQEGLATLVRKSFAVSETVKRIQAGEIPKQQLRIIAVILRNTNETEIHRMRGATENKVYLHSEGNREAVYDADGKLVQDGINDGSYNYVHPRKDPLRHFTFDIAPWLLFGHSSKDPTTRKERVHAYAADVFLGVTRARQTKIAQGKLDDVEVEVLGNAEAIAVFLTAIERGGAEELFDVFQSKDELSDEELIPIVKKFELGLRALVSDAKLKVDQGTTKQ